MKLHLLSHISSSQITAQSLVIIDPTIEAHQHLVKGVVPGTTVVILDPEKESIPQITQALLTQSSVNEIHLISHGAPGKIQLGNGPLTLANLKQYAADLQQWRYLLGEGAKLFLYGCQVAAGRKGQRFIHQLGQLLRMGIAANVNPTGNAALGGNWDLSHGLLSAGVGNPSMRLPFRAHTLNTYPALLAQFSPPTQFPTWIGPRSVLVGDFNGDSIDDFATVNFGGTISVLLGDGSGGFNSYTNYDANGPTSVVVSDFNNDSISDFATANSSRSNAFVLLGDGSGGFSRTIFSVENRPLSVVVGDFNGDSINDLVINADNGNVSVLLGDGSGGFSSPITSAVGDSLGSVVVADINGDSINDLATINTNKDTASVLLGDGSGGFSSQTTYAVGDSPRSVVVGDFNGDSVADLATANYNSNDVSVLLGDGSGGFSSQTTYAIGNGPVPSGASSIVVGDFNGDSVADLATANTYSGGVSVLLGDGSGEFSRFTAVSAGGANSLVVGDFNGDSIDDLATANYISSQVSIITANDTLASLDDSGNLSITDVFNANNDNLTLTTDQINITINDPNNLLHTFIDGTTGNGTHTITVPTSQVTGSPILINTGDGNDTVTGSSLAEIINGGDGNDTLIGGLDVDPFNGGAGNQVNPDAAAFNKITTVTKAYTPSGEGWYSNDRFLRQVADVNGDGRADIIGFANSAVLVALGQSDGTFSTPLIASNSFTPSGEGWSSNDRFLRQVADVNGDGRADIIGFANSAVLVALGQSDGTFSTPLIASNSFTPSGEGWTSNDRFLRQVADVNGDGQADIIGFANSAVLVALGQSDGTFSTPLIASNSFTPSGEGWYSNDRFLRQVADVNGDGRADIVGFANSAVLVALGQSDGTFSTPSIASNSFTPLGEGWSSNDRYPRQVADVNGDGRADIIGFANSAVLVALGQSDGTFGSAFVVHNGFTSSGGTWSNFDRQPRQIADVNGDGQADIIGFGESQVSVSLSVSVNDHLIGGTGNDRLVSGAGNDVLTGGKDADTFVFAVNAVAEGINRITDFNADEGDMLEIDQADFGVTSLSDITFNAGTNELFVGGTYNDTLAILTNQMGFDVDTHITLV